MLLIENIMTNFTVPFGLLAITNLALILVYDSCLQGTNLRLGFEHEVCRNVAFIIT